MANRKNCYFILIILLIGISFSEAALLKKNSNRILSAQAPNPYPSTISEATAFDVSTLAGQPSLCPAIISLLKLYDEFLTKLQKANIAKTDEMINLLQTIKAKFETVKANIPLYSAPIQVTLVEVNEKQVIDKLNEGLEVVLEKKPELLERFKNIGSKMDKLFSSSVEERLKDADDLINLIQKVLDELLGWKNVYTSIETKIIQSIEELKKLKNACNDSTGILAAFNGATDITKELKKKYEAGSTQFSIENFPLSQPTVDVGNQLFVVYIDSTGAVATKTTFQGESLEINRDIMSSHPTSIPQIAAAYYCGVDISKYVKYKYALRSNKFYASNNKFIMGNGETLAGLDAESKVTCESAHLYIVYTFSGSFFSKAAFVGGSVDGVISDRIIIPLDPRDATGILFGFDGFRDVTTELKKQYSLDEDVLSIDGVSRLVVFYYDNNGVVRSATGDKISIDSLGKNPTDKLTGFIISALYNNEDVSSVVVDKNAAGTYRFYSKDGQFDKPESTGEKYLYIVYKFEGVLYGKVAVSNGDDNGLTPISIALPYGKQSSEGILAAFFGIRDVTSVIKNYVENGNICLRADDSAYGVTQSPDEYLIIFYKNKNDQIVFKLLGLSGNLLPLNYDLVDLGSGAVPSNTDIVLKAVYGNADITSTVQKMYNVDKINKFFAISYLWEVSTNLKANYIYALYYDIRTSPRVIAAAGAVENESVTIPIESTDGSSTALLYAFYGNKEVTSQMKELYDKGERVFLPNDQWGIENRDLYKYLVVFFQNRNGDIDFKISDINGEFGPKLLSLHGVFANEWNQVQFPTIIKSVWGNQENTALISEYLNNGLYKIRASSQYMKATNIDSMKFLYVVYYDKNENSIKYQIGYEKGNENVPNYPSPFVQFPYSIVGTEEAIFSAYYGATPIKDTIFNAVKSGTRTFYPFVGEYLSDASAEDSSLIIFYWNNQGVISYKIANSQTNMQFIKLDDLGSTAGTPSNSPVVMAVFGDEDVTQEAKELYKMGTENFKPSFFALKNNLNGFDKVTKGLYMLYNNYLLEKEKFKPGAARENTSDIITVPAYGIRSLEVPSLTDRQSVQSVNVS